MEFNSKSRILVVAAHPDDEIIGCGGTIARAISVGAHVSILFLGEGISARFPIGEYDSKDFHDQTAQRHAESRAALAVLGVQDVRYGDRLCAQFDKLPLLSIVKEIESVMEQVRPTTLLTHSPSEVNLDHRIAFEAVEVACRPTRPWIPKSIYTFEIACSGSWTFDSTFKPNVFVEVGEFWETKLKAWHCYKNEMRPFPFPRSDEGLKALAHYRGMAASLHMAEAFRLVRQVV
jgi:LmbE family N-acetylglucosaminyl deacetylase